MFLSFLWESARFIQNSLNWKEFPLVLFVRINRDPPVSLLSFWFYFVAERCHLPAFVNLGIELKIIQPPPQWQFMPKQNFFFFSFCKNFAELKIWWFFSCRRNSIENEIFVPTVRRSNNKQEFAELLLHASKSRARVSFCSKTPKWTSIQNCLRFCSFSPWTEQRTFLTSAQ